MIHKILVPVDGSGHSKKALEFACDLADRYGAKLHLLHVVEAPLEEQTLVLGSAAVSIKTPREELEKAGRKVIDAARRIAEDHGCKDVETEVAGRPVAQHIVERAKESGADMIVMGSRGLGSIAGLLMGSVSHKVSHLAGCTCVTVR